jgi:D-arabinose 1-dehydrogenase-like Zn-dependent alcohol dehydrogenase
MEAKPTKESMATDATAAGDRLQTGATPHTAPRTICAAQITAFRRPIQVVEVPVAAPRADGAVVRIEACGVCRSDWHFWNQDWGWMGLNLPLPTVLGHEVGGVVEEVGRDVRTVKVGDRVTIPCHEADGTCAQCRAGYQNLCDHVIIEHIGVLQAASRPAAA